MWIALALGGLLSAAGQGARPQLHQQREAVTDLEVTGLVPGVPPGESRFVSRAFLLGLPRITVHIDQFEDFSAITKPGIMVGGVYLDVLAARLGAPVTEPSAIEAICADGYAASFPSGYIGIHKPLFVLEIDGLSPHEWAEKHHEYDAGPYFVAYEHFMPHFKVLAHDDRPLEPDQITKLLFSTKAVIYAGIEPKEIHDPALGDSPVVSGFRIARQNCFRCHNSGEYGGTQAGLSWKKLGKIARARPEYFAEWVYDPQSIDSKSKMPANKNYDKATLDAITKYFATISTEGQQ
jgi:mono/diheme cytochrome c family protein